MTTFDDVVTSYTLTCMACPTQYEGTLADGRQFYFRYRLGRACLGLGADQEAAVTDALDALDNRGDFLRIGDRLDGSMDEDEFKQAFMQLWAGREDAKPTPSEGLR